MFMLLDDSGCSPEEFGNLLGVSGMTLRRWRTKPPQSKLPKLYIPAIREASFQLISQGRLEADLPSVAAILIQSNSQAYKAAIQNLGLREDFSAGVLNHDSILTGLSQIGLQDQKQEDVSANQTKVFSYKSLGIEWASRIGTLWKVVKSRKISQVDKLVAYGALFYLLTPIDFIPDQIPFFGLLDDFGVLGVAVTYYSKRFSEGI